jgi:hypothetical protein
MLVADIRQSRETKENRWRTMIAKARQVVER